MKTTNPNYQDIGDGYMRRDDAPDAKHKSRINWGRLIGVENARQSVSELRRIQNQRNEEYRRKRGSA